jgi:NADH:quinone reductase (non-electrogenic)
MPRPRVLIVGGGFAGIAAAKALRRAPVDVTLVDRHNHHVFQPLLYQVATASLAPSDIAVPIRWLLRSQKNATVLLGNVSRLDLDARAAFLDDGTALPYDYLILAAGTRHAYFGHDDWEAHAPGLKTLDDAITLRNQFLLAFERAELATDPALREALMTIVIVGGGPTGVELAGIMTSIARQALRADFRRIDTAAARIVLLEGGPRLVPNFHEKLSRQAERDLRRLGVEVCLDAIVTRVEADAVYAGDERIATQTVIWAAGNRASPLSEIPGVPIDRARHIEVEPDLSVPGHPEAFCVGDQATLPRPDGSPHPGVAQVAIQMGRRAGRNVVRDLRGSARVPFNYRNRGDMAVIGRFSALAQLPFGLRFSGPLAWVMWLFLHIAYLAGFRNRLSVMVQWGYAFVTWQRGVRLILRDRRGSEGSGDQARS